MFKDLLDFGGNGIYAVISTVLFFAIFVAVVVKVITMKKSHTTKMSNLPLEDGTPFARQHEERP
jgi:hypothetical protein